MGEGEEIEKDEDPICDYCGGDARAVVYCRADTARLCLSCDRHVHLANSVSSKHHRSLLCNSCSSAQSAIFCPSHGRVLCSNCDFEAHNRGGGGPQHDRRPVESFSGCPSVVELVGILGLGPTAEILKKKDKDKEREEEEFVGGFLEQSFWACDTTPGVARLDDLIVPGTNSSHGFRAMNVPPLPKNRNLACGKQKEEILQQLRELVQSEGQLSNDAADVDLITELQSLLPQNNEQHDSLHSDFDGDAPFTSTLNFEASELQWNSTNWHQSTDPVMLPYDQHADGFPTVSATFPDEVADFKSSASLAGRSDGAPGHVVVGESLCPVTPKYSLDLLCPDRDSVISRYREKRKTRRYDKTIRYESRKARADSRVRVKGRFVKVNQEPKSSTC